MNSITINPKDAQLPTRDQDIETKIPTSLPESTKTFRHPVKPGDENASLFFIGTATTILSAVLCTRFYRNDADVL